MIVKKCAVQPVSAMAVVLVLVVVGAGDGAGGPTKGRCDAEEAKKQVVVNDE